MASKQLREAATRGDAAEVRQLIEGAPEGRPRAELLRGADLCGRTALHFATAHAHEECIAALLADSAGAACSSEDRPALLLQRTVNGDTALHKAAYLGHEQCAAAILGQAKSSEELLALLRLRNNTGLTALGWAEERSKANFVGRFSRVAKLLRLAEEEEIFRARAKEESKARVQAQMRAGSVGLLHGAMLAAGSSGGSSDEPHGLIEVLQRMAGAVLEAATREGSVASLRLAIDEAKSVGVEEASLEAARSLAALLATAAEAALQSAVLGKDLPSLHEATEQAAAAGVSPAKLLFSRQGAQKMQRRVRARTALKVAMEEGDAAGLQEALAEAEASRVDDSELVVPKRLKALLRKVADMEMEAGERPVSLSMPDTALDVTARSQCKVTAEAAVQAVVDSTSSELVRSDLASAEQAGEGLASLSEPQVARDIIAGSDCKATAEAAVQVGVEIAGIESALARAEQAARKGATESQQTHSLRKAPREESHVDPLSPLPTSKAEGAVPLSPSPTSLPDTASVVSSWPPSSPSAASSGEAEQAERATPSSPSQMSPRRQLESKWQAAMKREAENLWQVAKKRGELVQAQNAQHVVKRRVSNENEEGWRIAKILGEADRSCQTAKQTVRFQDELLKSPRLLISLQEP